METRAAAIRQRSIAGATSWPWIREFIRLEIAPYPGRVNTVARITVTATLVMLIVVTFRIPNAFLAALFSILLARENLAATWRTGRVVVLAFVGATLYTLLGVVLFRGSPITHFFWVIGSLYLIFFIMRTMINYAAATAFAIPIGVALPIWDRSVPNESQVEGTLWLIVIIAIGAGVTVGTEALYRIFDRSDPLITSVDDMLFVVQQLAASFSNSQAPPKAVSDKVLQYNMISTGRLRTTLLRQGVEPTLRARRSALISLTGRLIGLAGQLERTPQKAGEDDAGRLRAIAERLGAVRTELRESGVVTATPLVLEGQPSSSFPMLQEMEQTVALFSVIFQRDEIVVGSQNAPVRDWWRAPFLPDAFQNPEYQRFAFAGCLSASVCYILYNVFDWPTISTCVLTCIVTALSTIGASLQVQFLRLAGYVVGGLVLGIAAQILILPCLDSIFGFTLFFAAGTAIASWFATSSPRLSFFGVQMALAFYFVNLQAPYVQTDLTIARDRVAGALLGILAMGFIFDRFGTKSDAEQLQKMLVRNVRMLAQLAVCPIARGSATGISQIGRLRSQINDSFAGLESQMDSVWFEGQFRHQRGEDVAERERILRTQPVLRSIYLFENSLISHRRQPEIDSELTEHQNQALEHFLNEYSDKLTHIAAWIAHEEDVPERIDDASIRQLQQTLGDRNSPNSQAIADICQKMVTFLYLLRNKC